MFLRMVLETRAPMSTEPASSQMLAKMHAVRKERALEPTLVPNEFATSFAPIPKARTKAIKKPTTTISNSVGGSTSILTY